MTYTLDFDLSLGLSKAGLTMAAKLVDTTGGDVGSKVTTGFTEIGEGFYLWHYASIPDGHRGGVKFYKDGASGTILAFTAINPEEGEYADNIEAKLPNNYIMGSVDKINRSDEIDATKAVTDNLPDSGSLNDLAAILADTGTDGVVLADNAITAAKIAANSIGASELATDAIGSNQLADSAVTKIFAYVVEGTLTFVQMFRVIYAVLAGKSSGGGTTLIKFRDDADGKDRVSATVDSSGNRTAMANDGT